MASPTKRTWLTCVLFLCVAQNAMAFSLLGPFAPWMTRDVGFIHDEAYDIGGPRNLGDEFRWNVPVLTYGFDEDFKNFFGQPGIDAVEKAVAMLNALPPASQIVLSNRATQVERIHLTASSEDLYDVGSMALALLVEQIGLANPGRSTWVVNSVTAPTGEESNLPFPNDFVIQRNFDPVTLTPTRSVNGDVFTYSIIDFAPSLFPMLPELNRIVSRTLVNQAAVPVVSVAEALPNLFEFNYQFRAGNYFLRLSNDDLGGLKYLLHPNNVHLEPTLATVRALGGGTNFVNVAFRPGVDKITFQRFDPDDQPITNIFVDPYLLDGESHTQTLQRRIATPDVLFTAANHPRQFGPPALVRRTMPNFSHQNGSGSGILQPEVVISFDKLGDINREPWFSDGSDEYVIDPRWSSFDSRTIKPSIFPVGPAYQSGRTLSVRAIDGTNSAPAVEWKLRLIAGVQYAIENSVDLKSWSNVTNITALPIHTLTNSATADSSTTFWRARRISGQ